MFQQELYQYCKLTYVFQYPDTTKLEEWYRRYMKKQAILTPMNHAMGKLSYNKTAKSYWISQQTYECQFNQLTETILLMKLWGLSPKKSSRKVKPLTLKSSYTTALSYTIFHIDWTMMVTITSKYTLKKVMKQRITTTFNKAFNRLSKSKLFLLLCITVGKGCGFLQFTKKPTQGYRWIYAVACIQT